MTLKYDKRNVPLSYPLVLELSKNIGIKFNYQNLEDIFKQDGKNWQKASEKTKHYLSW